MQTLPTNVRPRRLHASTFVGLIAVVICACSLLLGSTASASSTLHCNIELPSYNTDLCGQSKKKAGERCAEVSHETPSPPSASYAPGSTSKYRIRFQVEGMIGCDPAGVRTVTYFQELRNGPTGSFVRSDKSTTRATNVRFLLRDTQVIPYNCSADAPGSAVRTLVRLTWRPDKGWGGGGTPPDELTSTPESICAVQAQSARIASLEITKLAAHDADSLATQIQSSARRRGSPAMMAVKMVNGCCGVRALEVYERARPGSLARSGVYFLELVMQHGAIEKVAISEFTTKRGYKFGGAYDETPYSLDMGPSRGNWSIGVGHAGHPDIIYTTGKVQLHEGTTHLTAPELQAIYSQALGVLTKASDHAPLVEPSSTAAAVDHTADVPSVYLNVPMAHPERPATIPNYELNEPDAHDPAKFLSVQSHVDGVTWSSWGGSAATGSGQVVVSSSDTRPGHTEPYGSQSAAVSIIASDLVSCGGRQLYTAYTMTLSGAEAEPRDFAYVKDRSLPCRMQALTYYAGIEKVANTTGDCLFHGVTEQLPSGFGYLGYCRMEWKGWGKSSTVGTGIARAETLPTTCDGHEECDYGIRVQLNQPEWCPTYGMSYTREKLEVFGSGVPLSSEPQTKTGVIAPSVEHRLRATIGHGKPRVYDERVRASQECEAADGAF